MIRLLIFALISLPLCAQPAKPLLEMAAPGAQALLGVEWSRLAKSQYVADIKKQFGAELQSVKGLELLEGLERFILSATPGEGGKHASVLVLVEGRFNPAELKKLALEQKATAHNYRGVEILHAPQQGQADMDLAIFNERTLLLGDPATLHVAITRLQTGGARAPVNSIARRALALSAKSDIWGVASPEIFSAMGLAEMSGQIKAVAGNDPVAAEFLKALKTVESGGPVEFGFNIDQMKAPNLASMKPKISISMPAAPVAQQRGGKVKIYGLDEGVREFELK